MRRVPPLSAAVLALAACNSQPQVSARNAKPSEVAAAVKQAAADIRIEPGEWVHKSEVQDVQISGVNNPRMAEMMKQSFARAKTATSTTHCVTPEEAAKPTEKMFADADKSCRYDHFTMGGGRIDAAMTCAPPGGGKMAMAMNGSYSSTSFDMTSEVDSSGNQGPVAGMHIKAHVTGQRVGACKA